MNDLWYPSRPEGTEFAYSIYVFDSMATSVPYYPCTFPSSTKKIENDNSDNATLYPNPSFGELILMTEITEDENILIEIFDITGRTIHTLAKNDLVKGKHYFNLDISAYGKGVYTMKISTPNKIISNKKFIKL
jgi:hypothetical protein